MSSSASLSRRTFLAMAAAAPVAASVAFRAAKDVPVGLELYSVRGELAKDLLGTVAAVGAMGYKVVEFYAPYLAWTPATATSVRKVLDDSGLVCRSTHNNGPSFTPEGMKKAIELNQIIGSKYLIMASAPQASSIDAWKALADQLTAVSAQLKPQGMATGYHNHQVEWRPVDGKRPMDVIAASTPKDVVLQFDVGTCLEVGADPIAWINANPGRIKSVHCKDWRPAAATTSRSAKARRRGNGSSTPSKPAAASSTTSSSRKPARPAVESCRWCAGASITGKNFAPSRCDAARLMR
jgi:sugar phosphate isomerase/epimerase